MSTPTHIDPDRRHDFLLLFDVTDGNPNGDPDADNMPRCDPETMHGWVTDVCLKRKIRDYAYLVHGEDLYVKHRGILAREQRRAYEKVAAGPSRGPNDDARRAMCEMYYDVRMFGAVMTTGRSEQRGKHWNCGQVRGPVQLSFARSADPIFPIDLAITRVALTNPDDVPGGDATDAKAASGQMGRRSIVPYALYMARGAYNPYLGADTGASSHDLEVLWDALLDMLDLDRSTNRCFMGCRGLYIFDHYHPAGCAPAHALYDRISVTRADGVDWPRKFTDYVVTVDDASLPAGIRLTRLAS